MSEKEWRVDVCAATYRRTELLATLLDSLENQTLDEGVRLRIVVVDNDAETTAREVVAKFAARSRWPVVYDVEPEKNIAKARNRALAHAQGEYLIFIDDDEYASPDWLMRMLNASQAYDADVVFGPVLAVYPEGTPDWIKRGGFFDRPRMSTGTRLPHGATNNTLVRMDYIRQSGAMFNSDYGLTGGEDIDFFWNLGQQGARMVWCDEALVWEPVSRDRMRIGWLMGRALRGGQMVGRIFKRPLDARAKALWLGNRLGLLLIAVAALPFAWLGGRVWGVKVLQKVYSNVGQLTSLGEMYYQEYKG